MSEQDKILSRVRQALAVKTPAHDGNGSLTQPLVSASPSTMPAREWLPGVGETFEQRVSLFAQNATELKASFYLLNSRDELADKVREICKAEGWKKVGTHKADLVDLATGSLGLPVCRTDQPYAVRDLETCDAGLTECEALVAQTGSVLVTSRSCGGRALSVLPPHHVVLARRDQLVADLPEAFALLKRKYAANYPSFISFITGPSRTGDIERILVLGAHGPKKLTILMC